MPYKPINGITTATAQTDDQRDQFYSRFGSSGLGINGTHDGTTHTPNSLFESPTKTISVGDSSEEISLFSSSYNDYAASLLTELYVSYDAAGGHYNPDFVDSSDILAYTPLKTAQGDEFAPFVKIKESDNPYYNGPNIKVGQSDINDEGVVSRNESGYDKSGNNRGFGSNEKNAITTETIANYLNLDTAVLGESSFTSSSDE